MLTFHNEPDGKTMVKHDAGDFIKDSASKSKGFGKVLE